MTSQDREHTIDSIVAKYWSGKSWIGVDAGATQKHHRKSHNLSKQTRDSVFKRDGGICSQCGMDGNYHIHHIVHRADGGTDDIDNLVTLCSVCHTEQHKGETVYNLMVRALPI